MHLMSFFHLVLAFLSWRIKKNTFHKQNADVEFVFPMSNTLTWSLCCCEQDFLVGFILQLVDILYGRVSYLFALSAWPRSHKDGNFQAIMC